MHLFYLIGEAFLNTRKKQRNGAHIFDTHNFNHWTDSCYFSLYNWSMFYLNHFTISSENVRKTAESASEISKYINIVIEIDERRE